MNIYIISTSSTSISTHVLLELLQLAPPVLLLLLLQPPDSLLPLLLSGRQICSTWAQQVLVLVLWIILGEAALVDRSMVQS